MTDLSGTYLLPRLPQYTHVTVTAASDGRAFYTITYHPRDFSSLPVHESTLTYRGVSSLTIDEWIRTRAWVKTYPPCLAVSEGL